MLIAILHITFSSYGPIAIVYHYNCKELQFQSAMSYIFVFMFKMVILIFFWHLQGYFLIGTISQHKLHHIWDKFCHDVLSVNWQKVLKNALIYSKIAPKNSEMVIFVENSTLTWCPMSAGQQYIF